MHLMHLQNKNLPVEFLTLFFVAWSFINQLNFPSAKPVVTITDTLFFSLIRAERRVLIKQLFKFPNLQATKLTALIENVIALLFTGDKINPSILKRL